MDNWHLFGDIPAYHQLGLELIELVERSAKTYIHPIEKLLVAGAGAGQDAVEAAKILKPTQLLVSDLGGPQAKKSLERLTSEGLAPMYVENEVVLARALKCPDVSETLVFQQDVTEHNALPESSVDAIVFRGFIHLVGMQAPRREQQEIKQQAFDNAAYWLRPGGFLAVESTFTKGATPPEANMDFHQYWNELYKDRIVKLYADLGFSSGREHRVVGMAPLPLEDYIKMGQAAGLALAGSNFVISNDGRVITRKAVPTEDMWAGRPGKEGEGIIEDQTFRWGYRQSLGLPQWLPDDAPADVQERFARADKRMKDILYETVGPALAHYKALHNDSPMRYFDQFILRKQ